MPQDTPRRSARYRTFLLSVWAESGLEWRCRLEDPHTGRRIGFHDTDDFARYLRALQTEANVNPEPCPVASLLAPGGGQVFDALGVSLTLKTTGADSGGQWLVMDYAAPPNFPGPPPHYHKVMTEIFYVLAGQITFHVGEHTLTVGPGGYAYVPPGTVHGFSNQSATPARFLGIVSPAILEQYFYELLELVKQEPEWPPADMSKVLALMAKHDTFPPGSQS